MKKQLTLLLVSAFAAVCFAQEDSAHINDWRKSRLVPYAQFLFGGADAGLDGSLAATGRNSFATAAGGGIDIAVTNHFAVKPIQVEYVTAQLPDVASNRNSFQNNLRYSAGVVFRLGEK
jgi:hypothetical protein